MQQRRHVAEVRLPEEILADLPSKVVPAGQPQDFKPRRIPPGFVVSLEDEDFLRTDALRHAIHAREAGRCFYCLRVLTPSMICLDHVVPRAQSGNNSYRNLVSSCRECHAQKGRITSGFLVNREQSLSLPTSGLPATYLDQHSLARIGRDLSQPACPHAPVFRFEETLLAHTNPRDKWANPRLALLERGSRPRCIMASFKRPFP